MKVLVCGSRGITDKFSVASALFEAPFDYTEIVHGGARGVDTLAGEVAANSNIPVKVFLPDWKKYGRGAGIRRNIEMLDYADAVIAVWDGESRGTKQAIEYAKKKGKQVYIKLWK